MSRRYPNCSSVSCRGCDSPSPLPPRIVLTHDTERCRGVLPTERGLLGVSMCGNGEVRGSLGVMGNELVPLAALASSNCMREARAVNSRSSVCFSTVFSPGNDIRALLMPLVRAEVGNEWSSSGVYCLARLERMLATAADVSSCGIAEPVVRSAAGMRSSMGCGVWSGLHSSLACSALSLLRKG